MSEGRQAARRGLSVGMLTGTVGVFVSRVLGLGRDMVLAAAFGTSDALAAFILAFTVPNLLRNVFGEGAMNEAFVPLFSERQEQRGRESAFALLNTVLSVAAVCLTAVVVLVAAGAALGAPLTPPGMTRTMLQLLPVVLPYGIFVCLGAILAGALNTYGYFAVGAHTGTLLNLAMIGAALWLCPQLGEAPEVQVYGLAAAVSLAGVVQLAISLPQLRREGFRPQWRPHFRSPEMRELLRLLGPRLLGSAVYEISIVLDRLFAGFLGGFAVTSLYYSERLVYLPVGLFSVALAAVALPAMARAWARGDPGEMTDTLVYSLRHVVYLTTPCVLVLGLLGGPLLALFFQRGAFDARSLADAHGALLCYLPGIPAFAALKVVRAGFYSRKDMTTPVRVSFYCLLLNVALNTAFMLPLQQRGLALATSIAALVNFAVLLVLLGRSLRPGREQVRELAGAVVRLALALVAAAAALLVVAHLGAGWWGGAGLTDRVLAVAVPGAAAAVAFVAASWLSGAAEPRELLSSVRRRRARAAGAASPA